MEIDMKEQFVFDPLISKRQQYLLATQLVRAILKVSPFDHFSFDRSLMFVILEIDDVVRFSSLLSPWWTDR